MTRVWFGGLAAVAAAGFLVSAAARAEDYQLPPEVTPQMRAACEADVRRHCVGAEPTVAKVKRCVMAKFFMFGRKCQVELASLGIGGK